MEQFALPHNAIVLVGDGRKAIFLRNSGAPPHPALHVDAVLRHDTPANRDIVTDAPGRNAAGHERPRHNFPGSLGGGARSAIEDTDWHQLEEDRFVHFVTSTLSRAAHAEPSVQIAIILPPKALGELRRDMDKMLKQHIIAEIAHDLTGHTLPDIAKRLSGGG